jgi:hypothetical protein
MNQALYAHMSNKTKKKERSEHGLKWWLWTGPHLSQDEGARTALCHGKISRASPWAQRESTRALSSVLLVSVPPEPLLMLEVRKL